MKSPWNHHEITMPKSPKKSPPEMMTYWGLRHCPPSLIRHLLGTSVWMPKNPKCLEITMITLPSGSHPASFELWWPASWQRCFPLLDHLRNLRTKDWKDGSLWWFNIHDLWWFMMVYDGFYWTWPIYGWCMMVYDGLYWCINMAHL